MLTRKQNIILGILTCSGLVLLLCVYCGGYAIAQQSKAVPPVIEESPAHLVHFARTESPRDTLESFLRLRDDMERATALYLAEGRISDLLHMQRIGLLLNSLLDQTDVPLAKKDEVSRTTMLHLLDLFGRTGLPQLSDVPDEAAYDHLGPAIYIVPNTPIRIVRLETGERAGEFLFDKQTVQVAPHFAAAVEHLPLRSGIGIDGWSRVQSQLTGPLIPAPLIAALPEWLKASWLGTPIWKLIAALALVLTSLWGFLDIQRRVGRRKAARRLGRLAWMLTTPLSLLVLLLLLQHLLLRELLLWGHAAELANSVIVFLIHAAGAWIAWLLVRMVFEWIIQSPRIQEGSLDANLLRLLAGLIGFVVVVVVLGVAASGLGLPVLSLVAGLGVGGLAVALAIRPTLENLIGGLILYIDKPVRVGDFCSFGDDMGMIEHIGIRSTEVRSLDSTLISIPNAQFADMKLVNWSHTDKMIIEASIALRPETSADLLRFVLVKIREMALAHPLIETGSVRVRYVGPRAGAREIAIRVFVCTKERHVYHAVREDFFLRLDEILEAAGCSHATMARTVYVARDPGPDSVKNEAAESAVESWREGNALAFPESSEEEIARLDGTLDYPPRGTSASAAGMARSKIL